MKPNITELIVEHDLCIGCGVCSGICPANVLPMEFNAIGEYVPNEVPGCLDKCTLCINVCPFVDENDDEDTIGKFLYPDSNYSVETGHYLNSYMTFALDDKDRLKGASGGTVTWVLKTLYDSKMIDQVVCVGNNQDTEKLFDYQVYSDLSFLKENPGSVYYPLELSGAIEHILKIPGKYVITGLPCFIKSIRLAQQKSKKLRERIKFTIALTCGQMKSKYYTQHLSILAGMQGNPSKVHYRGKNLQEKSSNFYFSAIGEDNTINKLYWNEGPNIVWNNRMYTPTACDYCDDVFGETADISVMDAWLPEYMGDPKGTSLVITRSHEVNNLIKKAIENKKLGGNEINIQKVIKSQGDPVNFKKDKLPYRLFLAKKAGRVVPAKRVKPSSKLNYFAKKEIELKHEIQQESKRLVKEKGGVDTIELHKRTSSLIEKAKKAQRMYQRSIFPRLVIEKIIKIIREH